MEDYFYIRGHHESLQCELENKQLSGRLQFPLLIPISCFGLCHFWQEVKTKAFEQEQDSSKEKSGLHEKLILG